MAGKKSQKQKKEHVASLDLAKSASPKSRMKLAEKAVKQAKKLEKVTTKLEHAEQMLHVSEDG